MRDNMINLPEKPSMSLKGVNSICPTFIRTPLTEPTFQNPDRVKWIEDKIKIGRVAEVADIMGAVLYLATDLSSMVTGTSIFVDRSWAVE